MRLWKPQLFKYIIVGADALGGPLLDFRFLRGAEGVALYNPIE